MSNQGFHPDLRYAWVLPRRVISPRTLWVNRLLMKASNLLSRSEAVEVRMESGVSLWVHRPTGSESGRPGLLWIHGGGFVGGTARQDDRFCSRVARELNAVVASVEYRLAPEHPYPTPLEDCYAALRWLAQQPDVDRTRIAVGGASAGGGLATALCLLANERGEVVPAFQLLVYPMLDDRTTLRTDIDERRFRIWDRTSNRFGWQAYLGGVDPDEVPALAAPARAEDLAGLPPAWIGVGTHDLFHDEDVAYAERLEEAGVRCTLTVVPGAYHAFDKVESSAPVSRAFVAAQMSALAGAFDVTI